MSPQQLAHNALPQRTAHNGGACTCAKESGAQIETARESAALATSQLALHNCCIAAGGEPTHAMAGESREVHATAEGAG